MKTVSWHGNEEAISGIFLSNVSVFTPQFDETGKWYHTYYNFQKKCHKKKKKSGGDSPSTTVFLDL